MAVKNEKVYFRVPVKYREKLDLLAKVEAKRMGMFRISEQQLLEMIVTSGIDERVAIYREQRKHDAGLDRILSRISADF